MDEVTLTGETYVCEIRDGVLTSYEIIPEQFGFSRCTLADLAGGSPEENAQIAGDILTGKERGPKRDVVVLNSAMALYLGIDDITVADSIKLAEDIIDSGKAAAKLGQFHRLTNEAKQ
jgi:anthranilate phosphoribosyltransferase